jgi:osmotically-inducible protein OsmY/flavin-binding protein dodecin
MDTHVVATPRESRGHEIGVSNHVVKVIEVLAESPHGWEDAAEIALREASRSLRNIASIYIQDLRAVVRDGRVSAWRVNAKVSFVVNDEPGIDSNFSTHRMGEETMRYRNRDQGREGGYRPSRGEAFPEYDDYGLHGDDRRQYRGRESYEQQNAGGEGGRSGMWANRRIAPDQRRDYDAPYRSNEDEDRRGYQDLGQRQEFESGGRGRPDYYLRWRDDRDESSRSGFERDRDRDGWQRQDDARRSYADDYSRTDYGTRSYPGRDFRDYGSRRPNYEEQGYSQGPYSGYGQSGYGQSGNRPGNYAQSGYGPRGEGNWQGSSSYDQGRYVSSQYDAQYGQQRRSGRGPKGYKRSDDRIREDVCDRLGSQYDIDASEVEVTVSNGEVTLAGTVNDRDQKFRVEHIADGVGGVSEVHNQLRVRRDGGAQTSSQSSMNVRTGASNQTRHS